MKRRIAIAAALGLIALGGLSGAARARACGGSCAVTAQYRPGEDGADRDRRYRPPYLRGPDRDAYGGRDERPRTLPPARGGAMLSDQQIWSIAKSRVPGRIVSARLHGPVYSFRIISNRGSIVDLAVDRYTGRILSVRGGQ